MLNEGIKVKLLTNDNAREFLARIVASALRDMEDAGCVFFHKRVTYVRIQVNDMTDALERLAHYQATSTLLLMRSMKTKRLIKDILIA